MDIRREAIIEQAELSLRIPRPVKWTGDGWSINGSPATGTEVVEFLCIKKVQRVVWYVSSAKNEAEALERARGDRRKLRFLDPCEEELKVRRIDHLRYVKDGEETWDWEVFVEEMPCIFCAAGEPDIHSATRVARQMRGQWD